MYEKGQEPVIYIIGRKGHVVRMNEDRKLKLILEARSVGKRGKPKIEWEVYMGKKGKSLQEMKSM